MNLEALLVLLGIFGPLINGSGYKCLYDFMEYQCITVYSILVYGPVATELNNADTFYAFH